LNDRWFAALRFTSDSMIFTPVAQAIDADLREKLKAEPDLACG